MSRVNPRSLRMTFAETSSSTSTNAAYCLESKSSSRRVVYRAIFWRPLSLPNNFAVRNSALLPGRERAQTKAAVVLVRSHDHAERLARRAVSESRVTRFGQRPAQQLADTGDALR